MKEQPSIETNYVRTELPTFTMVEDKELKNLKILNENVQAEIEAIKASIPSLKHHAALDDARWKIEYFTKRKTGVFEMKREIKFRAWCNEEMFYFSIHESAPIKSPIMQYTGLKDIDEKEIYESDILSYGDGEFLVLWDYEELHNIKKFHQHLQIIGNIYENPELLNKVEE